MLQVVSQNHIGSPCVAVTCALNLLSFNVCKWSVFVKPFVVWNTVERLTVVVANPNLGQLWFCCRHHNCIGSFMIEYRRK